MSISSLRISTGLGLLRVYEAVERFGEMNCRRALATFTAKVIMPAFDIDRWVRQQADSNSLDSPKTRAIALQLLTESQRNPVLAAEIRPSTRANLEMLADDS